MNSSTEEKIIKSKVGLLKLAYRRHVNFIGTQEIHFTVTKSFMKEGEKNH